MLSRPRIAKDEQERSQNSQHEESVEQENITAEWWLVGVGIAQTIALIGTLWAVWNQAKETARAAKAAADSVQAINGQADLMRRQLNAFEATQSAQLVIEDFSVDTAVSDNERGIVRFAIANVGPTIANEINVVQDGVGWHVTDDGLINGPKDMPQIKAAIRAVPSSKSGFSLGPAKKSSVFTSEGSVISQLIENKRGNCHTVLVGYRDIFGNEKWTGDCLIFVYRLREYRPLPKY